MGILEELLRSGALYSEISLKTGLSKATISYHAKRLGLARGINVGHRYDWSAVQAYYNDGHTVTDCVEKFGFSRAAWTKAVWAGRIKGRVWSFADFLQKLETHGYQSRGAVKRVLIQYNVLSYRCAVCEINEWRGTKLALQLDHINGDKSDWRLSNLRLLCPNCHSQTPTFAGRNKRAQRMKRNDECAPETVNWRAA